MLSKLSVKKPFTVLVGVIMIIILGIISLTNMTADLLPSMNMPYSIVYTIYAGASPEEVEQTVTRPIESSMATVSNIENIQSISSENLSLVILEFSDEADMDSVNLEMRENLDQITSSFDDAIGSPVIININPDMISTMIAAVDIEGYEGAELNTYVEKNIIQKLESIEGVASVSASGGVEECIEVTINPDKLSAKNEEVKAALSEKFADARQELNDAKEEIEDGIEKVKDGQNQVSEGKAEIEKKQTELATQLAEAKSTTDAKYIELVQTKIELNDKLSDLTTQKDTLSSSITSLKELKENRDSIISQIATVDEGITQYNNLLAIAIIDPSQVANELAMLGIDINGDIEAQINAKISELNEAKTALENAKATIDSGISAQGLDPEKLGDSITEAENGLASIEEGIATINSTLEQLEEGKTQIEDAKKQIEEQESTGNFQISSAYAKLEATDATLTSTKTQLDSALTQLESSEDTLDDTEESTYEKADLTTLITRTLIGQILSAQNFSMPAGNINESESEEMLVRVGDKIADIDELKDLVLMDMGLDGLDPIKLSDICDVEITDNSGETYAVINGHAGILLTFEKQTGYSTGTVSDKILETFEEIEEKSEGTDFTVLMDQGVYIDYIVKSVFENLIFGAIFAIIILALFLRNFRPTLIVAISIPVSVLAAIALMYFSNISLNIVSLSGLALAVGMLCDNSIVVIENIYRLRGEGVPLYKACVLGAKQVGGAIIASTLTTCCVFLPIVFTTGLTKKLFVDLALTMTYALLASLVIALTLVPAVSSGLLKSPPKGESKFGAWIHNLYSKSITFMLGKKAIILALAVALLAGSAYFAIKNGTSFMPNMESTQITVSLTTDEDTTFEEAKSLGNQVVDIIMGLDDVESVGAMTGSGSYMTMLTGGSSSSGGTTITLYVILNENKTTSNAKLKEQILEKTADLNCEIAVTSEISDLTALLGSGVSVRVSGEDPDKIKELAADLAARLEKVEGVENIDNGLGDQTPEFRISVDKDKASAYNLTVAQVFQQIYQKFSASTAITTISTEDKDLDVYVYDGEAEEFTSGKVMDMNISYTDSDGETGEVVLSKIATFTQSEGLSSITRVNQLRSITVKGDVADGYNSGLVGNDVQDVIDDFDLPSGYSMTVTGLNEQVNEALEQLILMALLGIVFVYLVMVAQFQSLLMPFIIMFTIPLAFTGGFLALVICDLDVSIIAMLGFIILTGVIVNNGIVLVDYINQLRAEGMEKKEAIALAGKTRLRPILMTALTTILGLLTLAFGMGMGADMVQPMAVVTIGGMIYGTFMTLWIVPVIYDIFTGKREIKVRDVDSDIETE